MNTQLNPDQVYNVVLAQSGNKSNPVLCGLLLSTNHEVQILGLEEIFDLKADGAIDDFVLIIEEKEIEQFFAHKEANLEFSEVPIIVYSERYTPSKIKKFFSLGIREILHPKMDVEEINSRIQAVYMQRASYNEMQNELIMATDSMDQMENAILQFENLSLEISVLNDQLQREIEERKKVENSLKLSQGQLKEAIATKDRFFSIIAHDLKNPFNALIGLSEILLTEYDFFDDTEKKLFLSDIKSASENTFVLLQELLEWSQAQMGKIKITFKKYSLCELVEAAINPLAGQAQAKEISLINETPKDTTVYADKYMVTTIIRNLVSNGIKFTPQKGSVTISAKKQKNYACISISDTGVGIPEKNLNKLFKIDEQVRTKGTSNEKGTGIGLILCKEFVENHKGKIWVESKLNIGTTFFFTLPIQ